MFKNEIGISVIVFLFLHKKYPLITVPQQLYSRLLLFLLTVITFNEMTEGHFICVINTPCTWRPLLTLQSRVCKVKNCRSEGFLQFTWNNVLQILGQHYINFPQGKFPLWHLTHKLCALRRKLGSILSAPDCCFALALHLLAAHFGLLVRWVPAIRSKTLQSLRQACTLSWQASWHL